MAAPTPATADGLTALGFKVSDTRADLLVGQGQILKNAGDNTSAILRDANNNTQFTNANIDRNGMAGVQETIRNAERLGSQANTIAWNETGLQNAGFAGLSAQNERINEAQAALADRAAKYQAHATADSFAHLSAQGENGFAREMDATTNGTRQVVQSEMGVTRSVGDAFARLAAQGENSFARQLDATTNGTRQVVQSEMGVTRSLGDGFRDIAAGASANYASLTAQNSQTKDVVAAYGNRTSDQTASVLATLSAQHAAQTRDIVSVGRELGNQAAINAAAIQLESSKHAAGLQLQASVNSKEAAIQAAVNAKDAALQAAVNSKESVLQASFLAKESLLEQSKWFALAEKTAMVNKCDIESKLASCCCEIKETVIGTANATQALVQTNESARVRDALSAAVAENSILRLRREERGPAPYPVPYPYPYPRDRSPRSRRGSRG